jgi:integrase
MATFRMTDGTGKVELKYTYEDTDRHGNVRVYVRRPGMKKMRLRETPGTMEFIEEYRNAIAGRLKVGESRKEPLTPAGKGSLRWLCEQYFRSAEYKRLEPRTQHVRRLILDGICMRDGEKPYTRMEARHVRRRRDEKAEAPEAANSLVKALRQVFAFAVENDLAERNPAKDVPYLKSGSEGFHPWSLEEVEQFEARHPVGSKARLALALLLYTGQRRSDVVTFGRQHVKNGWITFTQVKNRNRKPVTLSIPLRPELKAIVEATPSDNLTFLVTAFNKPFTANGFGNWFRDRCNEAGLPHCSAHGLRKAAASRLAELGAGESEIMAITGHTTSKEVVRYTRGARQKVLAAKAMARFDEDKN